MDKARGKKQKRLLLGVAAGAVLMVLILLILQGTPDKQELLGILGARDPILAAILPEPNQRVTQTDPDYRLEDRKSLYRPNGSATFLIEVHGSADGERLADLEKPDLAESARIPILIREGTSDAAVKWEGLGYSAVAPNATIEVRGTPRENRKYHNFKIRLEDAAGQYEGQSILNFKKAYGSPSRAEEKFALDLFATLPEMLSLRSKFVHLYLRDMTDPASDYENYGLYTLVEQPDEQYFINRGLDDSGSLYQAENFDFTQHPALLPVSDPNYRKREFEEILDIKQGDSHDHLLEMIDAVNELDHDIDRVLDVYFDRENLMTWLAMNIILGNSEGVTDGYLIYKPGLSARWYFLPGNMNGAMPASGDLNIAEVMPSGRSMFYGNLLYERVLEKEENLDLLQEKIDELMEGFHPANMESLTNTYIPMLSEFFAVNPDRGILKVSPEEAVQNVRNYRLVIEKNVEAFKQNRYAPARVELLKAKRGEGGLTLSWTASRQLGDERLRYEIELFPDPQLGTLLRKEQTEVTEITLTDLPAGMLYWRVTAVDSMGRRAGSTNVTELEDGSLLYGAAAVLVF